jgi:hypothetical protein
LEIENAEDTFNKRTYENMHPIIEIEHLNEWFRPESTCRIYSNSPERKRKRTIRHTPISLIPIIHDEELRSRFLISSSSWITDVATRRHDFRCSLLVQKHSWRIAVACHMRCKLFPMYVSTLSVDC